jgi:hypothetical protein
MKNKGATNGRKRRTAKRQRTGSDLFESGDVGE